MVIIADLSADLSTFLGGGGGAVFLGNSNHIHMYVKLHIISYMKLICIYEIVYAI